MPLTSGEFGSLLGMLAGRKVALLFRPNHKRRVANLCRRGVNPKSCRQRTLRIRSRAKPHFPQTAKRWQYLLKLLNPASKTYYNRIVLASLDSGVPERDLDPGLKVVFRSQGPPDSAGFRFSPDGKSLAFVIDEAGQDNIWIQPLDGSNVRKLTNFNDSERIQDFRWSPDGESFGHAAF